MASKKTTSPAKSAKKAVVKSMKTATKGGKPSSKKPTTRVRNFKAGKDL